MLSSAVSALSTFYQDSLNPFDHDQVEISTVRLLAKLPTIAAYSYKNSIGQPFAYRATRVPTMDWRASGAAVRPAASRIVSQVSGALTDDSDPQSSQNLTIQLSSGRTGRFRWTARSDSAPCNASPRRKLTVALTVRRVRRAYAVSRSSMLASRRIVRCLVGGSSSIVSTVSP